MAPIIFPQENEFGLNKEEIEARWRKRLDGKGQRILELMDRCPSVADNMCAYGCPNEDDEKIDFDRIVLKTSPGFCERPNEDMMVIDFKRNQIRYEVIRPDGKMVYTWTPSSYIRRCRFSNAMNELKDEIALLLVSNQICSGGCDFGSEECEFSLEGKIVYKVDNHEGWGPSWAGELIGLIAFLVYTIPAEELEKPDYFGAKWLYERFTSAGGEKEEEK